MSSRLTALDWGLISAILLLTVFHAAMLGGVFRGDDAIAYSSVDLSRVPEGNAPGIEPSAAALAEADASADLPGRYVPSQGKKHTGVWPLGTRVPYCAEAQVSDACYASMPPTSGLHVPVQRAVRLEDGTVTALPPSPGVYDFDLPREAVPHIQEHAGVFVGYNCQSAACESAVEALEAVVIQELSLRRRVVMARFSDLPADTIGMASWTRVDTFAASEFDAERVAAFIRAHSCRFDPEGFCGEDPPES